MQDYIWSLCQIYAEAATSFFQMCSPQQTGFKDDSWMLMSHHQRPCIGVEAQRKLLCWHLLFIWWTKTGRCIVYEANNDHALDRVYLIKSQPFLLVRRMREKWHQRIYVGLCPNKHPPTLWKCLPDLYNSIQKWMSLVPFLTRWEWGLFHGLLAGQNDWHYINNVADWRNTNDELFLIFNRVIG